MSTRFARAVSQVSNRSGAPVAEALALLVANEPEAALRWGAAALERDPSAPLALIVTSRALARIGRTRAAIDGLVFAVERAIDAHEPFLALVAIDDLRALGAAVAVHLDRVAAAFCEGAWLAPRSRATVADGWCEIDALSAILRGPALASKATQIVYEAVGVELPEPTPIPLFGGLSEAALREVLEAFDVVTVPAGHRLIEESQASDAGYLVACGELEIVRHGREDEGAKRVIARLGSGSFFGEMGLLAALPASSSVVAKRSSILLVVRRAVLEGIAARHVDVAFELAAHCRRSAVTNLGGSSPVMGAVPAPERAALVERLELRVFERGDRLVRDGDEAPGLHLVVAGEVAVVARDGHERVVLETLGAGATVGEVELVLCREAEADVIAVSDAATLFLRREDFFALAEDHPSIVHGLYAIAVQRHLDTKQALESGSANVDDDCVVQETDLPVLLTPSRARVQQSAPPPVLPVQPRISERMPTPVRNARALVDPIPPTERAPSRESLAAASASIPPISKTHPPPASRPTTQGMGSLAKLSLQGAAAVAVAAGVAVFTSYGREAPSVVAAAGTPPPSAPLPMLTASAFAAYASPMTPPAPAVVAPSPSQTRTFLTSALPKTRPRIVKRVVPPSLELADAAAPEEASRAAAAGEDEYGGRE